jgi:hypothetical protein
MEHPKGYIIPRKEDLVCKLQKSHYGLKQSPRQWYKTFETFMLTLKVLKGLIMIAHKESQMGSRTSRGALEWSQVDF